MMNIECLNFIRDKSDFSKDLQENKSDWQGIN